MVEFGNSWDQDDGFDDDLLRILDFPMDCLEGDGLEEDWDISNSEFLGPIPSNILIGLPTILNEKINTGPPRLLPRPVAPITGTPEQKQLSNNVSASSSHILELAAFETHSPVSVLESSGSCLGGKSLSFKPEKAIPVRSRSKRVRPVGVNPWLLVAPVLSTSRKTLNTKKSKESKKCVHCESTKTPQWREGPLGPKTLCNACGVRYRSGRLFPEYRPASSPSFVPSKHSNAHKKVIEMRNKAKEPAGKLKIPGDHEQKQLSNHVGSSTSRSSQNKFVNIQEPAAFETQCPVLPLQSSGSYVGEKSQESTLNTKRSKKSKTDENSLPVSDCAHVQNASSDRFVVIRKCVHCDMMTTQWREGPMGPLCNACRVQYLAGRLFPEYRPAISPTFVPSKHENPHKRVTEMRNKAKQTAGKIMVAPISSQPAANTEERPPSPRLEFVPITGAPEQKQLSNHVGSSTSHIRRRNKFADFQELGAFETQGPVSLLQSSSVSCLSLKPDDAIPVRNRSKRVRPAGIDPSLFAQNTLNTKRSKKVERKCGGCESTKAPLGYQTGHLFPEYQPPSSPSFRPAAMRTCAHCEATKTPQWREGPMGVRLCNACGVRYQKGRLLPEYRPAASPSFVPSTHSNSHKKVLGMRNNARQTAGKIMVAPMSSSRPPSPLPELLFDCIVSETDGVTCS